MKTIAQWVLGDSFSEVIKTEKKQSALESILWLFWRGCRRGNDVNTVFEVSQIWWLLGKSPPHGLLAELLTKLPPFSKLSSVLSPEGECRPKTVPSSHGRLTLILMHELVSLLLPESRIKHVFHCSLASTKCHSHGDCFTSGGNSETFLTTLISWWLPSFYKEGTGQEENSRQGGRTRTPWLRVLDNGPRQLSKITPHSPLHQTQNSLSNLLYTYLRVLKR